VKENLKPYAYKQSEGYDRSVRAWQQALRAVRPDGVPFGE
jgi:hypothetical protein